jgi:benzodiazapine receptor
MDKRYLQAANAAGFIVMVVVNALANILPLNGVSTAELSDSYPNYFVPAGYVFSIWGVIYLLLLGFTVYQARPAQRDSGLLDRIGWLFVLSCLLNSVWIFLWHWRLVLPSVLIMFGLLGTLILIYLRLDVGVTETSRNEWLYVHLPFSVYLGWITVAPIANVTALLVSMGWPSYGPAATNWTILVIVVAVAIGLTSVWTRGDVGYNLVLVWAFAGIVVKQMGSGLVPYAAGIGAAIILLALTGVKLLKRREA